MDARRRIVKKGSLFAACVHRWYEKETFEKGLVSRPKTRRRSRRNGSPRGTKREDVDKSLAMVRTLHLRTEYHRMGSIGCQFHVRIQSNASANRSVPKRRRSQCQRAFLLPTIRSLLTRRGSFDLVLSLNQFRQQPTLLRRRSYASIRTSPCLSLLVDSLSVRIRMRPTSFQLRRTLESPSTFSNFASEVEGQQTSAVVQRMGWRERSATKGCKRQRTNQTKQD